MTPPFRFRTLKSRLVVYVIIALIPLLVLDVITQRYEAGARRDLVIASRQEVAAATAGAVRTLLVDTTNTERATAIALDTYIPLGRANAYLKEIRRANPYMLSLALLNPQGIAVAADPPSRVGRNHSTSRWFHRLTRSRRASIVGDVFIDRITGTRVYPIAVATRQHGTLKWVLVSEINPEELPRFIPTLRTPDHNLVTVLDSRGRVVLSEQPQLNKLGVITNRSYAPGVASALAGHRSSFTGWTDPVDGVERLGAWTPVAESGWVVGDLESQQTAMRPVADVERRNIATLLGFAALSLFLAWYFGENISRPIRRLSDNAAELASGNLSIRSPVSREDEIGRLAKSFNEMAANLEALSHVSTAATSLLDMQALLQALVDEVRRATKYDFCSIGLVDEEHEEIRLAAASGLLTEEWRNIRIPMGVSMSGKAAAEKRPVVVQPDEIVDEFFRRMAEAEGVRSAAAVPIVSGDEVLGVLSVFMRSPRRIQAREVQLLSGMAGFAAVGIQNARVYWRERRIAETLQRSFLPTVPEAVGDFEVANIYRAAWKEAEIGGDFYDFFSVGEHKYGVVIGDVSGKGLTAAVVTAMGKYMLRAFASEDRSPDVVLFRLNHALMQNVEVDSFITVFFGVLDTDTAELAFANAGHEPPLFWRSSDESCEFLLSEGTVAGVAANAEFEIRRVKFAPGDSLLLYTDGVTEARRDNEFFGQSGLRKAVLSCAAECSADELVENVLKAAADFTGTGLRDDVAMLAVRRRPFSR